MSTAVWVGRRVFPKLDFGYDGSVNCCLHVFCLPARERRGLHTKTKGGQQIKTPTATTLPERVFQSQEQPIGLRGAACRYRWGGGVEVCGGYGLHCCVTSIPGGLLCLRYCSNDGVLRMPGSPRTARARDRSCQYTNTARDPKQSNNCCRGLSSTCCHRFRRAWALSRPFARRHPEIGGLELNTDAVRQKPTAPRRWKLTFHNQS